MPRKKRQDYPGAWHHVMNRGARRAPIFKLKDDCTAFLEAVGEMVESFELEVHAYSLMPNHYHLLVRSNLGNLSRGMKQLGENHTQWLNRKYRWDGPVFRGRFKNELVEDEEHLRILIAYIHLNPVEAGLVRGLKSDCWTSHLGYLGKERRSEWLTTSFFLKLFRSRSRLHEFVEAYRLGRKEYPDDFNPETGLFKTKAIKVDRGGGPAKRTRKTGEGARNRPVDEVLDEVIEMTGESLRRLRKPKKGPGAHPARRFAIWALHRSTGLTQREVGKILNVSYYQVGRSLGQIRKSVQEPVKGWIETWLAKET